MAMIKILLLDDSQTMLTTERTVLERDGHEVVTARSAEEGLARAQREQPDLQLACHPPAADSLTAALRAVLMMPTIPSPPQTVRDWIGPQGKA